ncbi:MAG TPA: hypothetical protein VET26_07565, partial [Candidatus Sulfotelmatobacter sp.]|nr:hypothetical protein [Candidatus Sulfotelmatobacter sp.]
MHTPDLFDGRIFKEIDEGVGYAKETGFDTILERGRAAAEGLPAGVVYGGFSLGVLPAQMVAQTRRGAKGALLFHSAVQPSEFGNGWPEDVPLQVHMMEEDEWVVPPNEDLEIARQMTQTIKGAELFLYP